MSKLNSHSFYPLLFSAVLLLPGCDLLNKRIEQSSSGRVDTTTAESVEVQEDGSPVIATIDGRPLITKKTLEKAKNELVEANPQLKAMIAMMDEKQLDRNLADGLVNQAVIKHYIEKNNIAKSREYQDDLAKAVKSVKEMLNAKYFAQSFSVNVSDADIRDFYEKNKDVIPNLLLSRGGIKTMAASFDSEQAAKDFMTKLKENKNDLQKAAQVAHVPSERVKDFKLVNAQSLGIESELRDKILAMKSPATDMIKVDKTYWVIRTTGKEEAKYRPLDQVRNEIKQALEKEKMMEHFEKEVGKLKGEYNITINEGYFKDQNEQAMNMPSVEQPTAPAAQDTTAAAPAAPAHVA